MSAWYTEHLRSYELCSNHFSTLCVVKVSELNEVFPLSGYIVKGRMMQISIALIQETHLTENNVQRFQNKHYKLIAHSCASSKSRGVLILAQRKLPYTVVESGKDNNGRFVYVLLVINYVKILIANIYAPNTFDDSFLSSVSDSLLKYSDSHNVIAGDFNATLCPEWDRSSGSSESMALSSLSLGKFLTDLNLVDIWRLHNDKVKANSFHSGWHGSSSRIDYIFISLSIANSITHIDMLPILISDHAPVVFLVFSFVFVNYNNLVGNENFLSHMKQHINDFITFNKESCNNAQTLWETAKCFMRGVCIGYSSRLHSECDKRLNEIEKETKKIEQEQLINPSVANAQLLTTLKGEYRTLSLAKNRGDGGQEKCLVRRGIISAILRMADLVHLPFIMTLMTSG
uniref:exodeoxyribonuclease III n=1 Tax=Paramormyrops kingsleyae TaxID=1676925 RepID=A0A3B3SCE4_9TELE